MEGWWRMFSLSNLTISLGWRFKDMTAPQDIRRQEVGGFQLNGFLHSRKKYEIISISWGSEHPSPVENLHILQNPPSQVCSPPHYWVKSFQWAFFHVLKTSLQSFPWNAKMSMIFYPAFGNSKTKRMLMCMH